MLDSIDHLVLTVSDPEASAGFYTDVLGLKRHTCGEGRVGV